MPQSVSSPYQSSMEDLRSSERDRQNRGFTSLLQATNQPVDWAYAVWDDLLQILLEGDNRQRSIAAQVLNNLAKSDPKKRMVKDIGALINVTRDERFVTARHSLQSLWKVGVAGDPQRETLVTGLVQRFKECASEKNCTLIRYDILEVLRRVYDVVNDASVRVTAGKLITLEQDAKYRRKYQTLWRNVS